MLIQCQRQTWYRRRSKDKNDNSAYSGKIPSLARLKSGKWRRCSERLQIDPLGLTGWPLQRELWLIRELEARFRRLGFLLHFQADATIQKNVVKPVFGSA